MSAEEQTAYRRCEVVGIEGLHSRGRGRAFARREDRVWPGQRIPPNRLDDRALAQEPSRGFGAKVSLDMLRAEPGKEPEGAARTVQQEAPCVTNGWTRGDDEQTSRGLFPKPPAENAATVGCQKASCG